MQKNQVQFKVQSVQKLAETNERTRLVALSFQLTWSLTNNSNLILF